MKNLNCTKPVLKSLNQVPEGAFYVHILPLFVYTIKFQDVLKTSLSSCEFCKKKKKKVSLT